MNQNIRTLISEDEVEKKISQTAARISEDYQGKVVHLVSVLKGSVFFTC